MVRFPGVAASAFLGGVLACSAAQDAVAPGFVGTYIPVDAAASAGFASIVFAPGGTYRFTQAACSGRSCLGHGTFTFDGKSDLALTDDTSMAVRHLAVSAIAGSVDVAAPAQVRTAGVAVAGLVSSGGGPLVTGDGRDVSSAGRAATATAIGGAHFDGVAMKRAASSAGAPRVFVNAPVGKTTDHDDTYATDWRTVYNRPAQWAGTLAVTNVIQLWESSIGPIFARPNDLIATVKSHGLEIAIEMEPLSAYWCGYADDDDPTSSFPADGGDEAQEEFVAEHTFAEVDADLTPIYTAGGEVTYAALDSDGISTVMAVSPDDPCNWPLRKAVNAQIKFLKKVHAKYPDIQFGLIPNFPNYDYNGTLCYLGNQADCDAIFPGKDYTEVLATQLSMVHNQGEHLYFVHVDNPYNYILTDPTVGDVMTDRLLPLRDQVVSAGLRFGMISNTELDGSVFGAAGNQAFQDETIADVQLLAQEGLGDEDDLIIESWMSYPDVVLPETKPYTFMNTANAVIYAFFDATGRGGG